LTATGVRIEELSWKSLSKMLLLLRLAVVKLSSALSHWPGGFAAPTLTEARAAAARNFSASAASSADGGSLGASVARYTGRRASLAAAAFLYHSDRAGSGLLWCTGVKDPCGGSGARKVGTGREDAGEPAAAAVAAVAWAVTAADIAFLTTFSAVSPGRRKLAASTFVAGGGLGRETDPREPDSGDPRLRQACRAWSLLAAAAPSLSSLRREEDRNRFISTLASIWSRKKVLSNRNDFSIFLHFLTTNDIKSRRYVRFVYFTALRDYSI
jgi:hypothetical protein